MEAMFLGGGVWAEMEVPRVGGEVARMGKSPPRELKIFPAILFPILSSKNGLISLGGSPLEQI